MVTTALVSLGLKEIMENAPCHIYWMNTQHKYLGCNKLQALALGLNTEQEIVNKKNSDLIPDSEVVRILHHNNQKTLESKKLMIFEEPFILYNKKAVFLSHKKPIFDHAGQVVGLIGVSIDITEKNRLHEDLQKEKDYLDISFENILANLPGSIYWLDKNNVFLGCNEAQAKQAGLKSRHEIVGKTNYDMPWKEHADAIIEINKKVMKSGQEYSIEETGRMADGKECVYLSKKVPYCDKNGEILGILGVSLDITERKKIERELIRAKEIAEATDRLKTEFIHNMEHDIRTPFVGILGMTKILESLENDPTKKQIILDILLCTQELLDYSCGILDFSKIDSGAFPVISEQFNLHDLIKSVESIELPAAKMKGLHFSMSYENDIPNLIIGDEYRLKRILINLLSNAIKFTSQGFVNLNIKCNSKSASDIVLSFIVEDSGIGIEKTRLDDLFTKFGRLMPSNEGIYKGHGFGLRIVKQFVNEMEGKIDIKSDFGKGTTVICQFPFKLLS